MPAKVKVPADVIRALYDLAEGDATITGEDILRAFLREMAARGWHMRPDEATEKMHAAGGGVSHHRHRWPAMCAAAPELVVE